MKPGLEKRGNVTVLRVGGSAFEQGYQHGRLLADRIPNGALFYFERFLGLTIENSALPWLRAPLLTYLDLALSRRLVRNIPEYTHELMRGLAEGAGISRRQLERA